VQNITEYLSMHSLEQDRRANALCKKWNEDVYDKIQGQVTTTTTAALPRRVVP
jgi:hypothetical protein